MERRLILAIALSLLVLLSWSTFVSKFYHIDNKAVTERLPPSPVRISPQTPDSTVSTLKSEQQISSFKFSQEKFEINFIEPQAAIKEVMYKDYQSYRFPLKYGFLIGDKNLVFKTQSTSGDTVTFVYTDNEKQIIKRFIFPNSNYNIELEIEIQNLSTLPTHISLPLILGVLDFGHDQAQARFQDVTAVLKDKVLHLNGRKEILFEGVKFLGLRDRYFCAIIEPDSDNWMGIIKKINPKESEVGLNLKDLTLNPGQHIKQKFHIYLGPQELKLISHIKPDWAAVIYFGTFDFIAHLLLQCLEILFGLVRNWGWVIVILSILIYIILFPLTLKQMRSMKQMQTLQPAIEELRKTYKDHPQKLNKEIMEIYRQHKVNPFGGCLPLILQIPIFLTLYQVLIRSVVLKGANFLWIKDLSEPDKLFSPIIFGNKIDINILPILMTILMFIQQRMSTKATSSGSIEQQKLMMILFPLMFGFVFYRMPAGLVLYWFINSLLTVLYQFRISRAI